VVTVAALVPALLLGMHYLRSFDAAATLRTFLAAQEGTDDGND